LALRPEACRARMARRSDTPIEIPFFSIASLLSSSTPWTTEPTSTRDTTDGLERTGHRQYPGPQFIRSGTACGPGAEVLLERLSGEKL